MTKIILLILLIISQNSIQKCQFKYPVNGYTNRLENLIECYATYKEIYTEAPGNPELIGTPQTLDQTKAKSDPQSQTITNGHIVIENVDEFHFDFVTNQHIAARDYIWMLILIFTSVNFAIFSLKLFFYPPVLNLTEVCYLFSILLAIHFLYLFPLMGISPTPFRSLMFSKCKVIEEPKLGVEFSFSGLIEGTHFIFMNDWIRIRCPKSEVDYNPSDYIRKKKLTTPQNIGIVHMADKNWWRNRHTETNHIKNSNNKKLEVHNQIYKTFKDQCVDKVCWWGNENAIVDETDFYYVVNSTMLPGHSGLSCRESPYDSDYFGIVQGYHSGYGLNICSKLSTKSPSIAWIIFPFGPVSIVFLLMAMKDRLNRIRRGSLLITILVFFYAILYELIYL